MSRQEAIRLRQNGATYNELQRRFAISKSTLWRWLKAEGLVANQPQQYTERRLRAQKKAVEIIRRARIEKTRAIISEAQQAIGSLTTRELRLIGAALYWAEGAKQKERRGLRSVGILFSNSDPQMLRVFIEFLSMCCGVERSQLRFRLYIHETADALVARTYWAQQLGIGAIQSAPISWKRHKPTTLRTNVGEHYHGLLRIVVPKSTDLNRKISGWIEGIARLGSSVIGSTRAFEALRPGSNPGSPASCVAEPEAAYQDV